MKSKPLQTDHDWRDWAIAGAILVLALTVRLPPMFHSLWYDEMYTLIHYVGGAWSNVVAGSYSPNNHVLFTILAKLVTPFELVDVDGATFLVRLPSLIGGTLLPVVLAWPLRREKPVAALLIALIEALHPWLISSSAFARGYALLLLLAVLATNSLPLRPAKIDWRYMLLLIAVVYTQPLGIGIAIGHGVSMLLLRRPVFWTWFRSAALAGLVTILLYLPMFGGAKSYWTAPEKPSIRYVQFLDQTFRHAQAGYDARGFIHIATPLLILIVGSVLAWRNGLLRPALLSFGVASVFGLMVPLVIPLAGEVRALHWLIPLYCIAAAGIIAPPAVLQGSVSADAPQRPASAKTDPAVVRARETSLMRWTRLAALGVLLLTLCTHIYAVSTIPAMPIRDALVRARQVSAGGAPVIGLYMAAMEARALYDARTAVAYALDDEPSSPGLTPLERSAPGTPTLVVFYEAFIERDKPELWRYVQLNYQLVERLPGRISPAAIYRRR